MLYNMCAFCTQALYVHPSPQLVHVKDTSKELGQLQRLNTQLEEARSTVVKMQQYELMYKESRIRSKQMQVEVSTLQVGN